MDNEFPPQLAYKPSAFAKRVGVHRDTVYVWIKEGHVRSVRVGRSILIPAGELHRIAGHQEATHVS